MTSAPSMVVQITPFLIDFRPRPSYNRPLLLPSVSGHMHVRRGVRHGGNLLTEEPGMSNTLLRVTVLTVVCLSACAALAGEEAPAAAQKAFLAKRTGASMLMGTFNAYASFAYVTGVNLECSDTEIASTYLQSPYPDFYKPTWSEVFDTVARQTGSHCYYVADRDTWMFAKPAMPLPFTISQAAGWTSEERGAYVSYRPPMAPVGMDIYMMGRYSVDSSDEGERKALFGKVRSAVAVMFAGPLKKGVTAADMTKTKLGEREALFFTTPAPKPGVVWRQWVIADSGMAFVIVSAIDKDRESAILPDVEAMVKSFRVLAER